MSQPPANPYPSQPESGSYPPPQQGGYPVPQQGGQPFGDPAAPPAKKKSSVGKILLIVFAVLLVLCLGGTAVSYFAFKDKVGEVVDATNTRLVTPDTLGGRPKVTEPELQTAAEGMTADIKKSVPNATSTAGGFYGDPAKKDLVMIAGASGVLADPKKELDDATRDLSTELAVTNLAPVEAGPLGGEAKCGDGKIEDVPVGVCVWADRGSLGMIVAYFKSGKNLQAEFVSMRSEIEKRS